MDFSDERWANLCGGYRLPYDPRPALRAIEANYGAEAAWVELWNELHHQGDVGEASYASIPIIARFVIGGGNLDWNPYALAATIEEARQNDRNPSMPDWLAGDYAKAWRDLFQAGLTVLPAAETETLIGSVMAVLATFKRQPKLARMAALTEAERSEMLDEVGWG
jgi:hypothetical protein